MSKKKNNVKKFKVLTADWFSLVDVDDNIFDDCYIEACTQAIEKRIKDVINSKNFSKYNTNLLVNPVMVCQNLTDVKERPRYMNTYKILQNAGMPKKAENMRQIFMDNISVDLAHEPISSSMKQ